MSIKKIAAIALTVATVACFAGSVMIAPAKAATNDELQAQIAALLAQINALQAQLASSQGTGSSVSVPAITRDLTLGSKGDDVKALQQFLNNNGYKIAATGAGSPGSETTYFGSLTAAALGKFQAAKGITPSAGYFGAKTRAYLATLATTTPGTGTGTGTGTTTGTGISVALDSSNPVSNTLTKGSAGTAVMAFKITANDADAILNSVKLKRTGVGLSTDYSNVYIYDGATRLKNGKSITSDTNTVEFTAINLSIPKGTSKVVTVKADVYTSATASDINYIGITSASDISVTGGTISGTFPIIGNAMTIGSQSIGTVTIANGASVSKPTLGASAAKLGNYKVTAGANDIEVKSLTFVQNGSFANTGLKNLQIKYSGTVLATAAAMTGDKAVFTFATPFAITKSQNRTLELYADLSGGKTTDTIRFYVEETGDVTITDKQYGQNSAITNSIGSTAAYCVGVASNTCAAAGSLQGGAITLSDQGPTAATVRNNSTNIDLFKFNLTSTRNVTFKDYYVSIEQTTWDATTAKAPTGGNVTAGAISAAGALTGFTTTANETLKLVANDVIKITNGTNYYWVKMVTVGANTTANASTGTVVKSTIAGVTTYGATTTAVTDLSSTPATFAEVFDAHLASYLKNVKLVDLTTSNVLASTSYADGFIAFSDDFDMTAGQTRNFAIRADLDTSLVAANAFKAGVDFAVASTIKDNDANEYLATSDVVGGTTVGKIMTVGSASLTVARSSTPVSATIIKGMQNAELLGISFTSGASSATKLTELTVRLLGDDDNTFQNGEGDTAANSLADSVSLYNGDTLLSGPKALTLVGTIGSDAGYYKATFDGLSYDITAGATQKLLVKANIKNTISATSYLAATVSPADDVVAQDSEGNVLTIAVTADGSVNDDDANATANDDATPPVVMTINTTGTLTPSVEGAPSAGLVVAGATNVVMAKYKFNAITDGYTIDKLTVIADAADAFGTAITTVDNNIVRVGVRYTDNGTQVTKWGNPVSGITNLSGLNIVVPKDTNNTYVEVLADLNTISGGATSGEAPRLGISEVQSTANTFNAVGAGSSETKNYTTTSGIAGTSNVYGQYVRKSVPTVAKAGTASSLLNGENTLYGFTVAADSHGAISVKRLAISTSFVADINVSDLRFYRGASDITDSVSIRNKIGQNLKTGGSNLVTSTGSPTSDVVYITWDKAATDEEVVSTGSSNTYYLKGTVSAAEAGDSFSAYIADDTASMADGKVTTLRTSIAASPVATAASVNNTAAIFRVEDATHVYLDADNNGIYEATTDYLITTVDATTPYLAVAGNADTILPGELRYTTTDVAAGDGDAGVYFDIATTGAYNVATDPAFGVTKSITAVPANNAVMAFDIRYTTTGTTLYFDETDGGTDTVGTYAVNDDSIITDALMTEASTAPANNAYVRSLNANIIWSDQNNTSHAVSTADWTNGYLVSDLATASYTLSQ